MKSKGFTLIELLVVIAIIGILTTITLISLKGTKSKAYDAKIKSELSQILTNAEVYADGHDGSYSGYTVPAGTVPPKCSDDATYNVSVSTDGLHIAVWADLCDANGSWCIDSDGANKLLTSGTTPTNGVCP